MYRSYAGYMPTQRELKAPAFSSKTWREGRRLRAWELHQQGWTNVDIAAALGVSKVAVGQWVKAAKEGQLPALQARSRQGQARRLSETQLNQLPALLGRGPDAYGFPGAFWTCSRIALLVEKEFAVRYQPQHIGRLLHHLHWSYHKPIVCATQRDEPAIAAWLTEAWPRMKKEAEKEHRTIVFLDESAFYMAPVVTKTWAPVGEKIKLKGPLCRDHLSVIGGLTWEGSLYMQAAKSSLGSTGVIQFLRHLLQHIPGRILLLWDGARIHHSVEMKQFLALDTKQRLLHENFPSYAPELDPQEYIWRQLKHVDLRNLTSCSLDQLWLRMKKATEQLRRRVGLLQNLIKHAGLQ
jgi:transposase